MPRRRRTTDHGITTVEELSTGLTRDQAIVSDSNKASATRLVWFVAISGFALINFPTLADRIAPSPLTSSQLLWLSLPWVLTAVSGVAAHWLLGDLVIRDNEYYIMKQHSIRAFLANADPKPAITDVLDMINIDDTDKDVARWKSRVRKLTPFVTWLERATFFFLIVSILATVAFPAILSCLAAA